MRYFELFESKIILQRMDIPSHILNNADTDEFLSGIVNPSEKKDRLGIIIDNELVGFLTPRLDKGYWRTGAIYIKPEYRGKGYGGMAVEKFFSDKPNGFAFIDPRNISSRKSFERAGLKAIKKWTDPKDGIEYDVMIKGERI